ncbi:MAG: cardiolipin synthase [Oscillospiraceae bacterium]|nr:cardiolipin synthase [Oscillospiraceae bacterium]
MNIPIKLLKKIFNRVFVCVFGILLQIFYLMSLFWELGTLYSYSYLLFQLIGVVISFFIVNSDINPSYRIAWIMTILTLPIFGVMFFIFFGNSRSGDRLRRRMNYYGKTERERLKQNEEIISRLSDINEPARKQADYLSKFGGYPIYDKTATTYFPSGEEKFRVMLEELEKAEKFIFLEYFIIDEGEMWDKILGILVRKADVGVDVRVIYDDVGCLLTLPYKYDRVLEEKGIKCRVFNKFRPILSTKMNNRDHRKILVIDGNTAFTGGVNLADEYINGYEKHGHWKDSAIMVKGQAVRSFTMMFLTMWSFLTNTEDEDLGKFCPNQEFGENGFVVPFTDSPLDNEPVGENVYMNIVNSAKKYVYITTPYLIIDNEMQSALILAAKSGIDVRIITPHIPDKWYVHCVTKAYYKNLTKYGVKIYEYTPGFIHAKNFVSDDKFAVVGTINLDFRSLYLHFECGVWLYKTSCIEDIKSDFLETLEQCEEITYEKCCRVNIFVRIGRMFLRLLAPML